MLNKISSTLFLLVFCSSAFAAAPTSLLDLTNGINFADVSLAILSVAFSLVGFLVVWKGAQAVLAALGAEATYTNNGNIFSQYEYDQAIENGISPSAFKKN